MSKSISDLTLSQYRALVSGIPLYCPNAIFTVAGQTFTATQAVTFLETVLNAVAATTTTKGAWKDAMQAEAKLLAQDGATVKAIRDDIATMFSNALNTLNAFEIAPRKVPAPLTAAKRAAATAKARATRIARGTTSKKQKAAVTGNVTGVTITPTTAPTASAPATSSAPAPVSGEVPAAAPATTVTASSVPAVSAPMATGSVEPSTPSATPAVASAPAAVAVK